MTIGSPTAASDAAAHALLRLDAALDALPKVTQRALRKGMRKGVDHRKLWWAKGKLGVSIPPELRLLYGWHNGQASAGGLFDRVFCAHCEGALFQRQAASSGIFLSLAQVAATGVHQAGYFDAALMRERFTGVYVDDYLEYVPHGNDAHPTNLIPFGWLPLGERDDDDDDAQVRDDDLVIALDDVRGAVVSYEPAHEEVETIDVLAPSLASFLEAIAASLEDGSLPLPIPAPARVRQKVDAAALLVQEVTERGIVALSTGTDLAAVAKALKPLLRTPGHEAAVAAVVTWFLEDERIEEVFADPEQLAVLVAEYVEVSP